MTRPTPEAIATAQAVLNYLSSSSDHSAYAVGHELQRFFQAAVEDRDEQWSEALHEAFGGKWIDPPEMMGRVRDCPAIPEWVGLHVKNAINAAVEAKEAEEDSSIT